MKPFRRSKASSGSSRRSPAASASDLSFAAAYRRDRRRSQDRPRAPSLLRLDRLAGPQRGLFEEAVGDLARAAPADRVDAGDREQVLDQRLGAGVIGAFHGGQHAGLGERALAAPVEDGRKAASIGDAAPEAAAPHIRQIERGEHAVEEMDVAEPRREPASRRARGLHGEGEDLRIRRLRVLAAEAFKPGLGALPALPGLGAKDRPEIGILRDPAGVRRGQIGPADRNCIFGAEAKLLARGVVGQEQPAANLRRHVEKVAAGWRIGGSSRTKPALTKCSSARSPGLAAA